MWRGATTKRTLGKGYSEAVILSHKQTRSNLPPTNKVTETRTDRIQSGTKAKQMSQEEAKLSLLPP